MSRSTLSIRHPLLVFPHGGVHADFTTYYVHIVRELMVPGSRLGADPGVAVVRELGSWSIRLLLGLLPQTRKSP